MLRSEIIVLLPLQEHGTAHLKHVLLRVLFVFH